MNNYNNFLLEYKEAKNKIIFLLSDKLKSILKKIDNNQSNYLLSIDGSEDFFKMSYLDVDEDNNNMITFLNNKDYNKDIDPWTDKNRQHIKIGKSLKFFDNIDKDGVEDFVKKYISSYKNVTENAFELFKIVSGQDIQYWYKSSNYDRKEGGGSSLHSSCMAGGDYVEMYANNPERISMVILMNEDGTKIRGRAILWDTIKPSNRQFMDRIYTIDQSDVSLFQQYAIENNFIYKSKQGFGAGEIIDPETNDVVRTITTEINNDTEVYPYVDTLYYYDSDAKILSNDTSIDHDKELLDQWGGTSDASGNEETLRGELLAMSVSDIADNYGIEIVLRNMDASFLEDYAEEQAYYYEGALPEFFQSWGHYFSKYLQMDIFRNIILSQFFDNDLFLTTYQDEINSFTNYQDENISDNTLSVEEIKKYYKNKTSKLENMITHLDLDDFFNEKNRKLVSDYMEHYTDLHNTIDEMIKSSYSYSSAELYDSIYGVSSSGLDSTIVDVDGLIEEILNSY